MRTNRRITVERPGSTLTGFSAGESYDVVHAKARAWVKFSTALIITTDGVEAAADALIRVSRSYEIQRGDVVRVLDDSKAYRVEAVDEVLSPSGRVVAYSGFLVRDETLEG